MKWMLGVRVVVITLLLAATIASVCSGIAAVLTINSPETIKQLQRQSLKDPAVWQQEADALEKALIIQPNNPDLHLQLAQMFQYRQIAVTRSLQEYSEDLQRSLTHYQTAVRLRPIWGYAWANIANVKSLLGQIDEDYYLALANSVEFGPREPPVQRLVVASGFRRWNLLTPSTQTEVLDTALRGLYSISSGQAKMMTKLIKNSGKVDAVCQQSVDKNITTDLCP